MSLDVWLALIVLFGAGGLTPGPAVMLVLSSSFRHGFKPAMLASLGIATANVGWLLLAVSGAAALAAIYPAAFLGLKIVGLLVIIYLGVSTIFGPLPDNDAKAKDAPRKSRLFARGLALQISSPLPLIYFGGLLPAYFDITRPVAPQFWIMLATVTVTELFGLAFYAASAEKVRHWLHQPRHARNFNIIIGLVMIGSGLWAVLSTI